MTEILAYRIVIVALVVMACAWARLAQRQSNAMKAARNQALLGKTAVDWLRTHPEALALLTEYKATMTECAEELSAEADAAGKAENVRGLPGTCNDDLNLLLKAMIAQLEVENVRDLIRAATR